MCRSTSAPFFGTEVDTFTWKRLALPFLHLFFPVNICYKGLDRPYSGLEFCMVNFRSFESEIFSVLWPCASLQWLGFKKIQEAR